MEEAMNGHPVWNFCWRLFIVIATSISIAGLDLSPAKAREITMTECLYKELDCVQKCADDFSALTDAFANCRLNCKKSRTYCESRIGHTAPERTLGARGSGATRPGGLSTAPNRVQQIKPPPASLLETSPTLTPAAPSRTGTPQKGGAGTLY